VEIKTQIAGEHYPTMIKAFSSYSALFVGGYSAFVPVLNCPDHQAYQVLNFGNWCKGTVFVVPCNMFTITCHSFRATR
jgi:hypothetical protein